jgi:uncharacterized protein (DUF4415 family)
MARKPDNISQEAWDAVNSPALTDDELAKLRPARDVLRPKLFEKLTKGRGPQKAPTKEAVSLRLDRDVVDHFRAQGPGWQTEINRVLRECAETKNLQVVRSSKGEGWTVQRETKAGRSASLGIFATKTAAVKAAKTWAGSTLTQGPASVKKRADRTGLTHSDKKRG